MALATDLPKPKSSQELLQTPGFEIIKGTSKGGIGYNNGKYYSLYNGGFSEYAKPSDSLKSIYTSYLANKTANKQQEMADKFAQNQSTYTGLLQDQSKKTIQRNLAEKIGDLKQASSSRGFLRGSGTQRQQADALAGAQVETMTKDADIKEAMELQKQQFQNQALASKMSLQKSANQSVIDNLRQNILDNQRQSELWKSLGSVIGTAAGTYYGSK